MWNWTVKNPNQPTIWQQYKMAAIQGLLANNKTSAENGDFKMLGQTVTEISEAVADSAVEGDNQRKEEN